MDLTLLCLLGCARCVDRVDNHTDGRTDFDLTSTLTDMHCTGPTDFSEVL